jgi:hypothetical protein
MRLQTLISGIKLEIEVPGMKVSRGVNCHKTAKQDYGCTGNREACLVQLVKAREAAGPVQDDRSDAVRDAEEAANLKHGDPFDHERAKDGLPQLDEEDSDSPAVRYGIGVS